MSTKNNLENKANKVQSYDITETNGQTNQRARQITNTLKKARQ